ncbi:MAG: tRNA uridine-5-carboxymethylaminomethyl(34) synthesis GTPase MnmE, partial [Clostridia bacterium]|nr:tRNA uridine-5-carboxymethylaminomethyl(34) synthesis GTPase MnmE [Clostridia bacterium]
LRHMDAAARALEALRRAVSAPYLPLARQDLIDALEMIGEITGETLSEDAISLMFESFCVGK